MIVDAVAGERPADAAGDHLRRLRHGRDVGWIGAVDVVGVGARDHQHVAVAGREDVEERDGSLVLVDALGGHGSGDDAAEDAVAHGVAGYGRATGSGVSVRIGDGQRDDGAGGRRAGEEGVLGASL